MSECANGPACEAYDRLTWTPAEAGEGPLCEACLAATARDIAALPLDYRDLEQLLPRGAPPSEGRISGTAEASVPLDLHAEALQADIAWTLGVWEPAVREVVGLPPAPEFAVRPGWLVGRAASVLSVHVVALVRLGPFTAYHSGPEAPCEDVRGLYGAAELRRLHARATAALGLNRGAVRVPGPCGRCARAALEREPGSDRIRCRFCGMWITADDYEAYVGMALMTAAMPR